MGSTLSYRPLPIRALRILITKEPTPLYCSPYAMLTTGEIDVSQLQGYCLHVVLFYRFILVDIGEAGRHSDGGVLSNSLFGQALEEGSLSIPEPSPLPGIIHNM